MEKENEFCVEGKRKQSKAGIIIETVNRNAGQKTIIPAHTEASRLARRLSSFR